MTSHRLASCLCALSLVGCNGLPSGEQTPDLFPVVGINNTLVFADDANHRITRVDLSLQTPRVEATPCGTDLAAVTPRQGTQNEVLILSRGNRGGANVLPEPARLVAMPVELASTSRTYNVASPFNSLAQSDDGRYALTYFQEDASGRLLFNPNEIAITDLDRPPTTDTNPVRRTVQSFGGVPRSVVFSPPMPLRQGSRTLAVVLSDAYVTLLDVNNPTRPEVTVHLTLADQPRLIRPSQVLFDPEGSSIYIRAVSSNDLYVLQLAPVDTTSPDENDWRPSLNQLAAGQGPSDMVLFGPSTARRVLVASSQGSALRVIDARSNRITSVSLSAGADRLLLFRGRSPNDPTVTERVLAYSSNGGNVVSLVDLEAIETRGSRNVEPIVLAHNAASVFPLPGRPLVMFQDRTSAGVAGKLSMLDLEERTASPIFSEISLASAQVGSDTRALWVAPRGTLRIGRLDLATFHPVEVRLDDAVVQLVPIGPDPNGAPRVVAVHNDIVGSITLLDALDPARSSARMFRGFLLTDVLSRGVQ